MSRILTMSRAGREALGRIDPKSAERFSDKLMRNKDSNQAGA